jgi:hypothetical protein
LVEDPAKSDDSSDSSDEDHPKPKKQHLTDEEMFKACKGMTAHK